MYEHTGWLAETEEGFDKQDIQCALICVDEILDTIEAISLKGDYLDAYWKDVNTR